MSEQALVEAIGGLAREFGAHSFKKHTETRLTTIPGGPPVTSSLIRVGQGLGTVQSTYVRDDIHAQDFCSRICALLDPSDSNFDILPARFNPNVYPSGIDYEQLVPGHRDYVDKAPKFLGCLPYLVAAVVNQLPFLRSQLPSNHPLWQSRLWISGYCTPGHHLSLVKENGLLLGRGVCDVTGMRSTGVPLYVGQNRKLDLIMGVQDEQKEIIDQVESNTRVLGQAVNKVSSDVTTLLGVMRYDQSFICFPESLPFSSLSFRSSNFAHVSTVTLSLQCLFISQRIDRCVLARVNCRSEQGSFCSRSCTSSDGGDKKQWCFARQRQQF